MELARVTCEFSGPYDEYRHSKTGELMLCGAGVRKWFPDEPLDCSIDIVLHDRPGANRIRVTGSHNPRELDGCQEWVYCSLSIWLRQCCSANRIVYGEIQYDA